jgi:tetratricopeptide (TPR) repeat protein
LTWLGRRVVLSSLVVFAVALSAAQAPANPQLLLRQAKAAYEAGRNADAAAAFEAYLALRPNENDAKLLYGWSLYRLGRYRDAGAAFSAILAAQPKYEDARVGLGYVRLQENKPAEAGTLFASVVAVLPDSSDALRGQVLAAKRDPRNEALRAPGLQAARKLRAIEPDDPGHVFDVLVLSGQTESRMRGAAPSNGKPPRVASRAGIDYLEVADAKGRFRPIFLKGFNLGAALPGFFPSEFPPDVAMYRDWLAKMSDFGSNSIRLYTLLPPAFYQALLEHNRAAARPILLVQGVWTELPPKHDFSDETYLAEFHREIARVIDAVHGNLVLAPRPGHASGIYTSDVSPYLLAYIIGREWEPFAVADFNAMRPNETSYSGEWFTVPKGRAMECWVARSLDYSAGYEASRYNTLHALTFANWPTLDPISHPVEATRREEDYWKKNLGIEVHDKLLESPWEDDAVTLDSTLVKPTAKMGAGLFAAYHIYPNYPDFMNLQPEYGRVYDAEGPNRYLGYLQALKKHHGTQPVVVAEFGMSSSRGIAHLQPLGWHHGGVDERDQGAIVSRMFRNIRDARYAGGVVFEFMDEWFKGTWSVAPFEIPAENRRLWFNAESPEQSYGFLAARPASLGLRVDGSSQDWDGIAPYAAGASQGEGWSAIRALRAAADEGFLYLLVETAGRGPVDWKSLRFLLGVDTYDAARGERVLDPPAGKAAVPTGVEFVVGLAGPDASRMTVSGPYDPYSEAAKLGGWIISPAAPTGRFSTMMLESNRERFSRDGTRFIAQYYERGRLRFGSQDPASPLYSTLTDVAVGEQSGVIEMRIPWGLLNVTDPSGRLVLHRERGGETRVTEGFRFYLFATAADGSVLGRLPTGDAGAPVYRWKTWTNPKYTLELKQGSDVLRKTMQQLPDYVNDER